MSSSSVTSYPAKKPHEDRKIGADNGDVDRISDLPDELLCYMLSFLPTKQSVLTGVLSNRWKPLWTCVPVLYIDRNEHFPNAKGSDFVDFVNWVMNHRAAAKAPIVDFCLLCGDDDLDCDQSRINDWVAAATSNGVETLALELPKNLALPACVLSCTTLMALNINLLWHGDDFSGLSLPSLTILEIRYHSSHVYDCLRLSKLLSICPSLKHFRLRAVLEANSSTSEYLQQSQINLDKMRSVTLAVSCHRWHRSNVNEWICYILKKIYNVQYLSVSSAVMQSLAYASVNEFPIFKKLTRLQLMIQDAFPWASMISLLQNCRLRVLDIYQVTDNVREKPSSAHPHRVPACVSLCLSEVKFTNYHGTKSELDVVRYFLDNAKILKTVRILSAESLSAEAKHQNLKNLSACPRCSKRCQLLFD